MRSCRGRGRGFRVTTDRGGSDFSSLAGDLPGDARRCPPRAGEYGPLKPDSQGCSTHAQDCGLQQLLICQYILHISHQALRLSCPAASHYCRCASRWTGECLAAGCPAPPPAHDCRFMAAGAAHCAVGEA